jgi:hypothetical protein
MNEHSFVLAYPISSVKLIQCAPQESDPVPSCYTIGKLLLVRLTTPPWRNYNSETAADGSDNKTTTQQQQRGLQ